MSGFISRSTLPTAQAEEEKGEGLRQTTSRLDPRDEAHLIELARKRETREAEERFRKEAQVLIKRAELIVNEAKKEARNVREVSEQGLNVVKNEGRKVAKEIQNELGCVAKKLETDGRRLELSVKDLLVRIMEVENRETALNLKDGRLKEERRKNEAEFSQRLRDVERRENTLRRTEVELSGRLSGLKYSAVEEERLICWAQELAKREHRVSERERDVEKSERDGVWALEERERKIAAQEREKERTLQNRAAQISKRELEVEVGKQALERERKQASRTRQAEEDNFWAHQKKVSAVVAAETDALLAEQARLRSKFEKETKAARTLLRKMQDEILRLEVESGGKERENGDIKEQGT